MSFIGNSPFQGIVSGGNIQDGTVGTADLADSSVVTSKLGTYSVTTDKITDATITPAKLDTTGFYTVGKLTSTGDIAVDYEIDLGNSTNGHSYITQSQYGLGINTNSDFEVIGTGNILLQSNLGNGLVSVAGNIGITGTATFNKTGHGTYGTINLENNDPFIRFKDTDGSTNNKMFDVRWIGASGYEGLEFRRLNDDFTTFESLATLKPSGKFGIGTRTPLNQLDIKAGSSLVSIGEYNTGAIIWLDGIDGDLVGADYAGITHNETGLQFHTQSLNSAVTIKSDGKVGFGTSTPSQKFEVVGNAIIQGVNGQQALKIGDGNSSNYFSAYLQASDDQVSTGFDIQRRSLVGQNQQQRLTGGGIVSINQDWSLWRYQNNAYSKAMVMDHSNGNIGIGTDTPIAPLNVATRSVLGGTTVRESNPAVTVLQDGNDFSVGSTIDFTNDPIAGLVIEEKSNNDNHGAGLWFNHGSLKAGIVGTRASTTNWGTHLAFYTHPTATNVSTKIVEERMRISPEGHVGINTQAPVAKLDVRGNMFLMDDNGDGSIAATGASNSAMFLYTKSGGFVLNSANSTNNAWNTIARIRTDLGDPPAEAGIHIQSYPSTTVVTDRKAGIQSISDSGVALPLYLNKDGGGVSVGNISVPSGSSVMSVNGSLNLKDGFNLTWGGDYNSNYPTIYASDSGQYIELANQGAGSQTRFRVNATGIGVNLANPSSRFHIYENSAAVSADTLVKLQRHYGDIDGSGTLGQGNFIEFIMTDGNVNFTPQVKIGMVTGDADGVDTGITSEGNGIFVIQTSEGTDAVGNGVLTEKFRVNEKGNVGIGTSAPVSTLHVKEVDSSTTNRTSPITVMTLEADNNNLPYTGFGGKISFKNRAYTSGITESAAIGAIINNDSTQNRGGSLAFYTQGNLADPISERMRIHYTGGVGIGTQNPTSPLHVAGNWLDYASSSKGVHLGMHVGAYAAVEMVSENGQSGWIDFKEADGSDYSERIRGGLGELSFFANGESNPSVTIIPDQFRVNAGTIQCNYPANANTSHNAVKTHTFRVSAGNGGATVWFMRVRRGWWGNGNFRIKLRNDYYSGSEDTEFQIQGHTSTQYTGQMSAQVMYGDTDASRIAVSARVDDGGISGTTGYCDIGINVPSYYGYIVTLEICGSEHTTDINNIPRDGYTLINGYGGY